MEKDRLLLKNILKLQFWYKLFLGVEAIHIDAAIFQLKELELLDLETNYEPNRPVSYGHLAYLLATSHFDFSGLTEDEATSFEEEL